MSSFLQSTYQGKRVLVTGHTGFKGSWLCEWLLALGAEVHAYSLNPEPWQTLFSQLDLSARLAGDHRGDLSERDRIASLVAELRPDFLFHLAAQPLVRFSYQIPVETFATNVMGTIHVMDALRKSSHPCIAVMVTTDKCYENREWIHGYREEDPLGGYDPYSASKGAAEVAISSYRNSYFSKSDSSVLLASARAGNVIGGGDWAPDRIIPDCIRYIRADEPIPVRSRMATRPWQHVLEPLSGYLALAASIRQARDHPDPSRPAVEILSSAFNFGPALPSNRTVMELVAELLGHTCGKWFDASDPHAVHEASKLNLSTDKAFHLLGWQPVWQFEETVAKTAQWYVKESTHSVPELTRQQIAAYQTEAAALNISWALPINR